jgi:hypothetical protein
MLFDARIKRMTRQRHPAGSFRRIILPVFLLMLVPIFTYTGLEIASLSERESLLKIYIKPNLAPFSSQSISTVGMWSTDGKFSAH